MSCLSRPIYLASGEENDRHESQPDSGEDNPTTCSHVGNDDELGLQHVGGHGESRRSFRSRGLYDSALYRCSLAGNRARNFPGFHGLWSFYVQQRRTQIRVMTERKSATSSGFARYLSIDLIWSRLCVPWAHSLRIAQTTLVVIVRSLIQTEYYRIHKS